MRRLYIAYPLQARLFGHVDTNDYQIRGATAPYIAQSAEPDTISGFAQPLLEQGAHEIVFLVYHDVQHVQRVSDHVFAAISGRSHLISIVMSHASTMPPPAQGRPCYETF